MQFALIGGLALQSAGVTRATRDIDLLILSENSKKVKDIMLKGGYELIHESPEVLNFCSDNIDLGRVDFLLAHRTYALAMLKNAQEKEILDRKFTIKVLRAEDQIGLKVQSSSNDPSRMHQDMADIVQLVKNNYSSLNLALLKEYFSLFDRADELQKILKETRHVK